MYIYIFIYYCYLAFHKLFCISDFIDLRYMLDDRTFQNEVKPYFTDDLLHFQSIYEACGESLTLSGRIFPYRVCTDGQPIW